MRSFKEIQKNIEERRAVKKLLSEDNHNFY